MSTCVVSGLLQDPSETAISGAVIRAKLNSPVFVGTNQLMPYELSTTSSATGTWSLTLSQALSFTITIEYPPNSTGSRQQVSYAITTPTSGTASFSSLATEL